MLLFSIFMSSKPIPDLVCINPLRSIVKIQLAFINLKDALNQNDFGNVMRYNKKSQNC